MLATDQRLADAIQRAGLATAGEAFTIAPLAGGVSSDIVRVVTSSRSFCIKRALPTLKVAADWRAPIARNHSEANWLRTVASLLPDCVPAVLAEDRAAGWFAMQWLPPQDYPVWKAQLRDGAISAEAAARVGRCLAHIHGATANRADLAARFQTDEIFWQIRLEPYLVATADKHPDCGPMLRELADATLTTRLALVHGDVSPKNILMGPHGPVFLDAECAWYGDPAFDLAFCLNHLLLKSAWRPHWLERYLGCFAALTAAYIPGVSWESPEVFERRCARLLPALLLARVDGKSPVEYIVDDSWRDRVRRVAKPLVIAPAELVSEVAQSWRRGLET
jgi:aminoglycoside phosphotransferase (APT) family kinase protein